MSKLKLAVYWGAACGGCDVAILDIHEKVLAVKEACDFLLWPIAMDFKYADVEALPDGHIDVTLFSGAVRNTENRHLAQLLRRKSNLMVAFGSCAHTGGIPALANFTTRAGIFERAYLTSESTVNPDKVTPQPRVKVPEGEIEIPVMFDTVHALDQEVDVDYYVPGCPPNPDRIWEVLSAIVSGAALPPKGSVIGASDRALCDSCERKRVSDKKIGEFKRIALTTPDPEMCFLDQGLLCLGPVTRDGCGLQCVKHSAMPCRGCYGLPTAVKDQGAKMIAAVGSIIDAKEPEEIARVVATLPDQAGYFYRFSASHSLLQRRIDKP
jgi:F420-non-reducing hydrogenase small subunit